MTKEQLERKAQEQVKLKEKKEQPMTKERLENVLKNDDDPQMQNRQLNAIAIQSLVAQNKDLQDRLNDAYAMIDAAVNLTTLSETIISEQRELINNYKELLNMR